MEINFRVEEEIAVLSCSEDSQYSKELNKVSWNGREPTLDIRTWRLLPNGEKKPLKGCTFSNDEARNLLHALSGMKLD